MDSSKQDSVALSAGRQLFFVHIQKTAGRSVANLLSSRFSLSSVLQQVHVPWKQKLDLDSFQCLMGHVSYGFIQRFARRPMVLTFLREPVDRALSAYYFFRRDEQATLDKIRADYAPQWAEERVRFTERSRDLSLLDFLQQEPALARTRLANLQTRALLNTLDPWDTPPMPDAAMLQEATNNLRGCEMVGLTERMDDSLSWMEHLLGWEGLGPMPRHNENPHRKRAADADPQAVEILTRWNQLDIELYKVAQELLDNRLEAMRGEIGRRAGEPQGRSAGVRRLPNAAAFTFDMAIHGRGWEPRESMDGEWFAWMGAEKNAWIDLQLSGVGPHRLQCRVAHVISPVVLDDLRVAVNGHPLEIRLRQETPLTFIEAEVPAAALRNGTGMVRIDFAVKETVRPCDINPELADKRSLAIALSAITIKPSP